MSGQRLPEGGPAGWLFQWAQRQPSRPALIEAGGWIWSYAEVFQAVRARADWMSRRGLGIGSRLMGVLRSPLEQRLFRWAAHGCGATEALLEPSIADAELLERIEILRPELLLMDSRSEPPPALRLSEELGSPYPALEGDDSPRALEIASWSSSPSASPCPAARILFTTGTTGRPRAVLQLSAHLDSAAGSNILARRLRADDVLLAALPPFHAAGSLFEDSMLRLGATIALPRREGSDWLGEALRGLPVTVASVIPSMLRPVLDSAIGREGLNHLRLLNYAGEAIDAALLERLLGVFRGELTRGYGLTEAGPLVSMLDDASHRKRPPPAPQDIGLPAPGVQVRIAGNDEPEPGELWVRSGHLMAGYLGDAQATAERLRNGWLHTGDLARWEAGHIHLVGRLGQRLRSGSQWIHPAEVEEALRRAPGVEQAVVVGRAHPRWGQRPVAFLKLSSGFSAEGVRETLEGSLSHYKWPDWCWPLPELPLTASGKVDRRRLKELADRGPDAHSFSLRGECGNEDSRDSGRWGGAGAGSGHGGAAAGPRS